MNSNDENLDDNHEMNRATNHEIFRRMSVAVVIPVT